MAASLASLTEVLVGQRGRAASAGWLDHQPAYGFMGVDPARFWEFRSVFS